MALEGLACSETSLDCRAALAACISLACFRRAVVSSSCTARLMVRGGGVRGDILIAIRLQSVALKTLAHLA